MATSAIHRLAISIIFISIISAVYAARPCKTLTLISSYSFSTNSRNSNPNSDFYSDRYYTVFTVQSNPHFVQPKLINRRFPVFDHANRAQRSQFSLPFVSENLNSFKGRTRDILGVVVALIFGVGCGALTAATTYLLWAVFMNNDRSYAFDEDYEVDGVDEASSRKQGYVKIPEPVKDFKEAA